MSDDLERLLSVGIKAIRGGNTTAARGLFRALAREYPHDLRVWIGLAGSATDREEQRHALEQVLAIDPDNTSARNGLARLDAALAPGVDLVPATLPAPPPPPRVPEPDILEHPSTVEPEPRFTTAQVSPPITTPADEPQSGHFPLMNTLALGIIGMLALLLLGLLLWPRLAPTTGGAMPTAILPTAELPVPTNPLASAPGLLPSPLATEPATETVPTPTTEPAPAPPTSTPTPVTTPTPAALPLGAVLEFDGWRATLLRPDYALLLDGAIGELQPEGRFVLALLAVSNGAAEPRTLPNDLFVLTDDRQRTYTPLSNASSIYLATFGPTYGDQALEEPFAAQSGMLSIPVLFDVAPDAAEFVLSLRGVGSNGWPITGGDTSNAGP